jgi:hypothetical protein
MVCIDAGQASKNENNNYSMAVLFALQNVPERAKSQGA